jgi:hypothetical protein
MFDHDIRNIFLAIGGGFEETDMESPSGIGEVLCSRIVLAMIAVS